MATLNIINKDNEKVGSVDVSDEVIQKKLNKAVLHAAVRMNLAGKHHGNADTKTRGEVNRTTKKVYKQKGTGNARHGSRKSSPFVGGGRVFGPHPREYTLGMNKKVRQLALKEAIRSKIQESAFTIVNEFPFKEIKTKVAAQFFNKLGIAGALVITDSPDESTLKSIANLKGFKVVLPNQLQVVDILKYKMAVVSQAAFEQISKRYLA